MKQSYLYSFLVVCCLLFANPAIAQDSLKTKEPSPRETTIEELSIFPNPVSGELVYVSSKKKEAKEVEIFNVLGKPVLSAKIVGKELNISALEAGIYILKIREGKATATRKLVVR